MQTLDHADVAVKDKVVGRSCARRVSRVAAGDRGKQLRVSHTFAVALCSFRVTHLLQSHVVEVFLQLKDTRAVVEAGLCRR